MINSSIIHGIDKHFDATIAFIGKITIIWQTIKSFRPIYKHNRPHTEEFQNVWNNCLRLVFATRITTEFFTIKFTIAKLNFLNRRKIIRFPFHQDRLFEI